MSDVQNEVRSRVEAFVAELATLVRQSALDAVRSALGDAKAPRGRAAASTVRRAKPASTRRRAAGRPGRKPAGKTKAPGRGKTGQKRDPKILARLVERLAAHITANPGQRIEQINKALGVPTKDLSLPIKKLLRDNRITSKGQKRSTTYSPK